LAPHSSDSRREVVAQRSEILSDATDLDVLLSALLDDESTPAAIKAFPRPASEVRREPTLVAPTRVDVAPDRNLDPLILPVADDEDTDAFARFHAESEQMDVAATGEAGTLAEFADPLVSHLAPAWHDRGPVPSKGRLDILPAPAVKRSLLLIGLVVALLGIAAVYFRADRGDTVVAPSEPAAAPTPVPAVSPVEPAAAISSPAAVDDLTPPRQPTARPRAIAKPSRQPASNRANPLRANVPPVSLPSSGASIAAAPSAPLPVPDRADRDPAPAQVALPNPDPPTPASSPTAPEAVTPAVVAGAAAPVTTAAAPVPASVAKATPARLLTGGPPEYPAEMRIAKVGGTVEVRFTIDSRGRVNNVRSVTGPPQLRSVAEAAVRRWRYEPAQLGNVAIDSETSVNFNFDPSARRPQQ